MKAKWQGSKDPVTMERRKGVDRRQKDVEGQIGRERRRSVEPRKPEVIELNLTASEWALLQANEGREDQGEEKAGM
jgi:hypothetical protein